MLLKEKVNFLGKKGDCSGVPADSFNLINPRGARFQLGTPLKSNSLDSSPGSSLCYLYNLELVASSVSLVLGL